MTLFLSTFLAIFLLAFQQINVIDRNYELAIITSFCIAVAQWKMIKCVHASDWKGAVYMGCGGALGVSAAMYIHP